MKKPDPDAENRKRWARVRLLNEELDRLGVDAAERTTSVTNKASFLAVSAGVLVAAATAQLWKVVPLFGVVSLALACVALACAAVALRPAKRIAVQARRLVDRHLDCGHTAAQVEAELVEDKATVLAAREDDLAARAQWVWVGFAALAVAAISLSIVFSIEVLGG
ncbi:hypothetical protein [Microbacterium sp. 2MCAF23]|uniref:hypothetical protein n=1 Tax=Microbacterium sp. 2MCAF23 TaxID=3232985 RepID=UPI003F950908